MLEKSYIKFRARVGTNNFNWAVGGTPGTYRTSGIVLTDVQNAQLKANYFLQCKPAGIKGTGNLTNTKFYCNTFEECFNGLEFDNATLSDQGDAAHGAGNQWINCTHYNYEITNPVSSTTYRYRNVFSENPLNGAGIILSSEWAPAPSGSGTSCVLNKTDNISNQQNKFSEKLDVYPNPTTSTFTVKSEAESIHKIELFDIKGNLVSTNTKVSNVFTIDLSSKSTGMYILKIYKVNSTEYRKVMKL